MGKGVEGQRQKPRVKSAVLHLTLRVANGPYSGSCDQSIRFLRMFRVLFSLHLLVCWVSMTLAIMGHCAYTVSGEFKA